MEKYYQISIDSLITTFSVIESGKEFYFNIKSEQSIPQHISVEDKIVASIEDKIYYDFIVTEISGDSIKLKKIFEISKSIDLNFETIGIFEQIDKDEYEGIIIKLFSDFNVIKSTEAEVTDLTNLKERFAKWLIDNNDSKKNYYSTAFSSNENKFITIHNILYDSAL